MRFSVQVEKPSEIVRKLTIVVPATEVKSHFERGLAVVQKSAEIKGFRKGFAPISIIKQFYGDDIRHRVFHTLIDESLDQAVRDKEIQAIGRPNVDTPDHKTGDGDHDHTLHEDRDFTYIATLEVMPEVKAKGYAGIALKQIKVDIKEDRVEAVIQNFLQSNAELVPLTDDSARPVKQGDFVDVKMSGGLVTPEGLIPRQDMQGDRLIEIGSGSWIPGFEDQLVGMSRGETKTFQITFPSDFTDTEVAGKTAEFTVILNEVKEKKLPPLTDEFVKENGYENLEDFRKKVRDYLTSEKTAQSEDQVRSDLLAAIIEKNPFEMPSALIEGQARSLAQEWAAELKRQKIDEKFIQEAISREMGNLRIRAEKQVRASLLLESIAKEEKIAITPEEIDTEIKQNASSMKIEEAQLQEYYAKHPGRKEDLEFRLRQERTVKFLLDKSKIKWVEDTEDKDK